LAGGFPTGVGATRVIIEAGLEMLDKVRDGKHPTASAMRAGEWGKSFLPAGVPERIALPEGSLLVDYVAGGGGFGDPIERDPNAVLQDFGRGWVSREVAERVYGVILSTAGKAVDAAATQKRREEIRTERKKSGEMPTAQSDGVSRNGWRSLLKFHPALEIASHGRRKAIRCAHCGYLFCSAEENYKRFALHRIVDLSEIMPPLASGDPYIGEYHLYSCPGCATQLQVDMFSPSLGGDPVLWDTQIDADQLN
jgi:N-methylhydantoinase B